MKLKNLIKRINKNNKPPGGWVSSVQAHKLKKKGGPSRKFSSSQALKQGKAVLKPYSQGFKLEA